MFPKSGLVGILEPRKRRMVLIGALVTIFTIAIIIATIGTITAVTPNNVSDKMKTTNFVDQFTTNPTAMTLPRQFTQTNFNYKERSRNITKETLLSYFKNISGDQTISGLHIALDEDFRYSGLEIIKAKSGKTPAMLSIQMPSFSAAENAWQSFTNKIISHWKDGYLILLVWGSNANPLGSMDMLKKGNISTWNDLTKNGSQLNKLWKKELDNLAIYLKQIQFAGVVQILDILPFINYPYALWSGKRGMNGSLKLYQITHDYLTKRHGLSSIIWTLSLDKNGGLYELEEYWPGDQYVDIALIYMWKNIELSFIEYQDVLDVAQRKLIAMEGMESIPTVEMLTEQPGWVWFTIYERFLVKAKKNELQKINTIFNHPKSLNKENCDL